MNTSAARFASPKIFTATGGRGPSATRLARSSAESSLRRGPSFGSLSRHTTVDNGQLERASSKSKRQVIDQDPELLAAARGKLCYECGTPTIESGGGLARCPECGSIQLKSGGSSHAHSQMEERASSKSSRAGSKKQGLGDITAAMMEEVSGMGNGLGGSHNKVAAQRAWRRISSAGHVDMAFQTGLAVGVDNISNPLCERIPIKAGAVDTGFFEGDRVKSNMRLPGACPGGLGWDPINPQTDEGVAIGIGRSAGELMVKFDSGGITCSMKMSHLRHCHVREPNTMIERSRCRQSQINRVMTIG